MVKPWVDAGCTAYLFDKQHAMGETQSGKIVKIGGLLEDSLELIGQIIRSGRVAFVAAFPECTNLAVSGACRFESKAKENIHFQCQAMNLVYICRDIAQSSGAPWIVENPVSVVSSFWRKPDHYFHPYEYGGYLLKNDVHPNYPNYICPQDAYMKKTSLWTGNGFIMPKKKAVPVAAPFTAQHQKLGGTSLKTKNIRSATPRGFALAVFKANKPSHM